MLRIVTAAAAAALVAAPAAAGAAQPTMPLDDVRAGMRCTAATVLQGTRVSTFDAEVVDVLHATPVDRARILLRFSGPAIEGTGVGPGFSGSPVSCPDPAGTPRVVGAISESVGDFGGDVALATPIEAILAEPTAPRWDATTRSPARTPSEVRRRVPAARPLAVPLTLTGASEPVGRAVEQAARRAGVPLVAVPRRGRAAQAPEVPLVPGAAVAAGLASGDLGLGALGTLTYVDEDRFWAFGHPYEGVGPRAMLLQDAVVHAVVGNPLGVEGAETYKLGSPGADRGVVTTDGVSAIAGRLGALPPTTALAVRARDLDGGGRQAHTTRVVDEGPVGRPSGGSPLGLVASVAVADLALTVARGAPARQTGGLCLRLRLRALDEPLRICNRYVVDTQPGGLAGAMLTDVAVAVDLVEGFRFGALRIDAVDVDLDVRRGAALAELERATAPARARRGSRVPVRVRVRERHTGERSAVTVPVRLPRDLAPGRHVITLTGQDADDAEGSLAEGFTVAVEDEDEEVAPGTVREVARAYARLERYDGVRARIDDGPRVRALRDPERRLSGRVRVVVRVEG